MTHDTIVAMSEAHDSGSFEKSPTFLSGFCHLSLDPIASQGVSLIDVIFSHSFLFFFWAQEILTMMSVSVSLVSVSRDNVSQQDQQSTLHKIMEVPLLADSIMLFYMWINKQTHKIFFFSNDHFFVIV